MPSQRQLEFLEIQEDYIKEEQANLKRELLRAQEEVKRIQSVPLVIGQFLEMVDASNGIVGSTTGSNYYVRILSTLNRELLKPSASVALHRHSNALVDILPPEADSSISLLGENEKPNVSYQVHMGIPQLLPPMRLHAWPRTSHATPMHGHAPSHASPPMRICRTSVDMIFRSRRSARRSSSRSHTRGCTSSWALTRPGECCCMGHQVRGNGLAGCRWACGVSLCSV